MDIQRFAKTVVKGAVIVGAVVIGASAVAVGSSLLGATMAIGSAMTLGSTITVIKATMAGAAITGVLNNEDNPKAIKLVKNAQNQRINRGTNTSWSKNTKQSSDRYIFNQSSHQTENTNFDADKTLLEVPKQFQYIIIKRKQQKKQQDLYLQLLSTQKQLKEKQAKSQFLSQLLQQVLQKSSKQQLNKSLKVSSINLQQNSGDNIKQCINLPKPQRCVNKQQKIQKQSTVKVRSVDEFNQGHSQSGMEIRQIGGLFSKIYPKSDKDKQDTSLRQQYSQFLDIQSNKLNQNQIQLNKVYKCQQGQHRLAKVFPIDIDKNITKIQFEAIRISQKHPVMFGFSVTDSISPDEISTKAIYIQSSGEIKQRSKTLNCSGFNSNDTVTIFVDKQHKTIQFRKNDSFMHNATMKGQKFFFILLEEDNQLRVTTIEEIPSIKEHKNNSILNNELDYQ